MESVIKFERFDEQEAISTTGRDLQGNEHDRGQEEQPAMAVTTPSMKPSCLEASFDNAGPSSASNCGSVKSALHTTNHQQQIYRGAGPQSAVRRFVRGDSGLLFRAPFFTLDDDYNNLVRGDTITACCHSCGVPIRGSKNVSSNFIKHLKRMHPRIHMMYETYKLQRMQRGMALSGDYAHTTRSSQQHALSMNGHLEEFPAGSYPPVTANMLSSDYFPPEQLLRVEDATNTVGDYFGHEQMSALLPESTATQSTAVNNNIKSTSTSDESTFAAGALETLMRRVLDEKLQCYGMRQELPRRNRKPSSTSMSSLSDIVSVDNSDMKSDYSQQAELQAQLSCVQRELRLLHRSQRRMQRQLDEVRHMLRRRTVVLDVKKLKQRS